jgi:AraC family transcriptional regulator, transcriptional activator of pobA
MKKIPIRQLTIPPQIQSAAGRFKIRRIEDIVGQTALFHDLHRHNFYFILAINRASGKHEIDFTEHRVTDNTIFFLRPGQVHQLELSAGSTGYLVEFDQEFYPAKEGISGQRLRKASNKNVCRFDADRFNRLCAQLSTMYEEYTGRLEGYHDIIKFTLDIFCIEYMRQSVNDNTAITVQTYTQERFEDFLELLEKHISKYKQVSDYVALMNLSAYQLNEITKSSIGKTASELITEHIILEAKRYLLATSNQVKEIADLIGYEDVSYFIRFFKKHTGYSPEAFRTSIKQV